MRVKNIEEILFYIDTKIDQYQTQYINGMKEVAVYIRDLQEIRLVLAQHHQTYL